MGESYSLIREKSKSIHGSNAGGGCVMLAESIRLVTSATRRMRQGGGRCVWTLRTASQEGREGGKTRCVLSRLCNYETSEVDELDGQRLTWDLWLKPTWGGKDLLGFHILSQSSLREVEAGIWRQERKQKPRRDTVYLTVSPGLLSRLFYHSGPSSQSQHSPQRAGISHGWRIRERFHGSIYRGHFLSQVSLSQMTLGFFKLTKD